MSKDKNVILSLIVVILFGILWFAMLPAVTAWGAGYRTVECEPGYTITYLVDGRLRVEGICQGMEPTRPNMEPDEPVYNYPYPVPDEPYPFIDNPCDRDWAYGDECAP